MEIRTKKEVKIYVLRLNSIFANYENSVIVAISTEYEKLCEFYNSNLLDEGYRDNEGFYRSFKEGRLYDFNPPPYGIDLAIDDYGHGISEEWINMEVFIDNDTVKKLLVWYYLKNINIKNKGD